MCLLRKITYGEFSEFIREKKIIYNVFVCVERGKKPFGRSMKRIHILKKSFPKKDETVIGRIDVI